MSSMLVTEPFAALNMTALGLADTEEAVPAPQKPALSAKPGTMAGVVATWAFAPRAVLLLPLGAALLFGRSGPPGVQDSAALAGASAAGGAPPLPSCSVQDAL